MATKPADRLFRPRPGPKTGEGPGQPQPGVPMVLAALWAFAGFSPGGPREFFLGRSNPESGRVPGPIWPMRHSQRPAAAPPAEVAKNSAKGPKPWGAWPVRDDSLFPQLAAALGACGVLGPPPSKRCHPGSACKPQENERLAAAAPSPDGGPSGPAPFPRCRPQSTLFPQHVCPRTSNRTHLTNDRAAVPATRGVAPFFGGWSGDKTGQGPLRRPFGAMPTREATPGVRRT